MWRDGNARRLRESNPMAGSEAKVTSRGKVVALWLHRRCHIRFTYYMHFMVDILIEEKVYEYEYECSMSE